MDDWTYSYSDPDVDAPSSQPMLLDQVWREADRLRLAHEEAAAQAEADRRAVDLKQARVWDRVDDGQNIPDVPLPFEAASGTAVTL